MDKENLKIDLEKSLKKDVDNFIKNIDQIRSLRVDVDSVRSIKLGNSNLKISHVSNVFSYQRQLTIEPFEKKEVNSIVKSIIDSDLGYKLLEKTAEKILFSLEPINQEVKKQIVLKQKQKLEEAKISIRKTRQYFISSLKKIKMQPDEEKRLRKEIEETLKKYELELLKIQDFKSKEIMKF